MEADSTIFVRNRIKKAGGRVVRVFPTGKDFAREALCGNQLNQPDYPTDLVNGRVT